MKVKKDSTRAGFRCSPVPAVERLAIFRPDAKLGRPDFGGDPFKEGRADTLWPREDHLSLKLREPAHGDTTKRDDRDQADDAFPRHDTSLDILGIATGHELPCAGMTGTTKSFVFGLALLMTACGGSKSKDGTTPGSRGKTSAMEAFGLTPPDSPWAQMSFQDREFYMIGKVNPIMKELFERHDLEEYEGFDCVDCHGEEMREINFEMPAPSMYVVPPEGTRGYEGMLATFPETVKFMQETVTPAMGKLLGIEDFSCAGCHPSSPPRKKKKTSSKKRPSGKSKG